MRKKILVTGGAGFIGSFLVDKLVKKGYKVRILDNLEDQIHQGKKPDYLNNKAEFLKGDVRNYNTFKNALQGMDAVFHLAALVGVGQSNYEVKKYIDVNIGGTANLLDILINTKHHIKKVITVSSMTGYGEGNYECKKCGTVRPPIRKEKYIDKSNWNVHCPNCGKVIHPIATDEEALDYPNSIYAISKKAQQDMLLLISKIYNIPSVVFRLFNVYGPRQSLSNPYTGVTAIFISRLKNNQPAIIYEDGLQSRDFISVHDVVEALIISLESSNGDYQAFNIGSGKPSSILEIAKILSKLLKKPGLIEVNQVYRKNDIRHCFADNSKAKKFLGWKPKVSLEKGFKQLIKWSETQKAEDRFSQAQKELKLKGLI